MLMTQSWVILVPSLWSFAVLSKIIQGQLILEHPGESWTFLTAASALLEPSRKGSKRLERHDSWLLRSHRLSPHRVLSKLNRLPGSACSLSCQLSACGDSLLGKSFGMKDKANSKIITATQDTGQTRSKEPKGHCPPFLVAVEDLIQCALCQSGVHDKRRKLLTPSLPPPPGT